MKNIILIGFMGCGKSTVGKALSELSGFPLVDTDAYIEEKFGITVSQFFEKYGEAKFRKTEAQVLCELLENGEEKIISTGGGLPIFCEDKSLFEKGLTVYLEVDAQTVISRLEGDTTRPLLQGADKEQRVKELLALRGPIYKSVAKLTLNAADDAKNLAKTVLLAKNNLE